MLKYNYSLNWKGKLAIAKYSQAIQRAVAKSAILVQREAKTLLNQSGKGVVAKLGLNKVGGKGVSKLSGAEKTELRYKQGLAVLSKPKTIIGKKNKITLGGSYGGVDRIYWYGSPLHRWVQSSQPGTPPHKQTGTLQRSIAFQFYNFKMAARIGPQNKLIYGRIQELGGKGLINLPPRPYLRPAFEKVTPQIDEIFVKELGNIKL
jgi:hypothetical protein